MALVAGLTLAAPAWALPGDPPIESLSPQDGASLPVDPGGIEVTFTCPAYRKAPPTPPFESPEQGLVSDYGAAMSTSPAVGSDGRLVEHDGIGSVIERDGSPGTCDARLGSGGFPRPQSTPGTYYWQAWRHCSGCDSGWEIGPVRRFVLRAAGSVKLTVQAKAFVGYPFVADIEVDGQTDSQRPTLQRQVGGTWRDIGSWSPAGGPIVSLPRGRHSLRAQARVGSDTLTSAVHTVNVVAAARGRRRPATTAATATPAARRSSSG